MDDATGWLGVLVTNLLWLPPFGLNTGAGGGTNDGADAGTTCSMTDLHQCEVDLSALIYSYRRKPNQAEFEDKT
jgi:hypothetical protein